MGYVLIRFLVTFLTLVILLFFVELQHGVQREIVEPFTSSLAKISVTIISLFAVQVTSYGRVIQSTANLFAISIEAGCNGIEAAIVLLSAIFAFPAKIAQKVIAAIAGFLTIQLLNLARIISLFYLGQWDLDLFNWIHLYLWPILIMLDVLLVFVIYLRLLGHAKVA